ncbi:EamA family transporter [Rhodobacterales bacterium HKCCE3408]|nr:EamA family transporter [Rhodobacterales bacterium HKCCE3408]
MTPETRPGLAALWMVGAIVSFTTMAVAGRAAGLTFDTFEIMTYRSAVGFLIVVVLATATGRLSQVSRARLPLHGLRNVFHFTGQNLWFYAITVIPLAQVFALEFTSPLWVIALAAIFLGEPLTRWKLAAGALGFIGVLVVLRPGAVPISAGVIAAASAAVFFAGTAVCTKNLTRNEPITSIMFWLTLMQLGLGIVCGLIFDGRIAWPAPADWVWLILIAIAGLTAHFSLTTALSLAPASVVMPLDFARLPVIALIGMSFYGEPLEIGVLLGAAIIFAAIYLNVTTSQRRGALAPKPRISSRL